MDEKVKRFKFCDLRFYEYLKAVMERLPEYIRLDIFSRPDLQILADENLLKAPAMHFAFEHPV